MIKAPTPCYFTVLATGEGAQALVMEISPGAAADIMEVSFLSEDFDSDIQALQQLDGTIKHVNGVMTGDLAVEERYNPLYIPSKMEEVDELLDIHLRNDGLRFTGFGGDPYTLKLVDVKRDDEQLAVFTARYHPFELPLYTDIVEAHDNFRLN